MQNKRKVEQMTHLVFMQTFYQKRLRIGIKR